jgi:topoisomerase-4 subunit A
MKEGDRLIYQNECTTTDTLLLFTSFGNYLFLPVHEMQDIRWKDMGQHIANVIPIEKEEVIISANIFSSFEENEENILFVTRKGNVKRTSIHSLKVQRYSKPLVAISLKDDDQLIHASKTSGKEKVLLATKNGYVLLFDESEISKQGLRAGGIKGINLKDDDFVASADTISDEIVELLCATHRGAVKKMKLDTIPVSSRATRGVKILRDLKANPHKIVGVYGIHLGEMFAVLSQSGQFELINPSELKNSDQYSNGSFILDTEEAGDLKFLIRYTTES